MKVIESQRLPSISDVRSHLHTHRDLLSRSILAFSGGKESVALKKLVHEIHHVPLVYAHCPELEYRMHEDFVRDHRAEMLDVGIGWDWLVSHPQHVLAKPSDAWAKRHHRGPLRRLASERGLTLLWGNRTADGNTVPAVRYRCEETDLWMPLRDLPNTAIREFLVESDYSPLYSLPCGHSTGTCTVRNLRRGMTAEESLAVVRDHEPEKARILERIWRAAAV